MAIKNQPITIAYVAWNTSTNAGQAGDAANHTLKLLQDGVEAAPTNAPAQIDATNCPGSYSLALTAGDMNFNCVELMGKSSTANVVILNRSWTTDRGLLASGVTTGAYATGQDPATLVLGASQAAFAAAGTIGGSLSLASSYGIVIDSALNGFQFYMQLLAGGPGTGLTVTAQRSINGGGLQPCANAPTEIGGGVYSINLAASDVNGASVLLVLTAPGCFANSFPIATQA